jgi:hypothetical protein
VATIDESELRDEAEPEEPDWGRVFVAVLAGLAMALIGGVPFYWLASYLKELVPGTSRASALASACVEVVVMLIPFAIAGMVYHRLARGPKASSSRC